MHIKLFVPIKQIAIAGYKWAYFVAKYSNPPRAGVVEFQWEFTKDLQSAIDRAVEVGNKWESTPLAQVLSDVVLVQYAGEQDMYMSMTRLMNTPLYTLVGTAECVAYFGAELVKFYRDYQG